MAYAEKSDDENGVPGYTPEFGRRLSSAIARIGSKRIAAEVAGVSPEQLKKWEDGKARPSFFGIAALAKRAGVSLAWLMAGDEASQEQPTLRHREELGENYVLIPRYFVRAAAGYGAVIESEQIVDYLAFRADWVRERLRRNPNDLAVIEAAGDSNAPTIEDGDVMLIDLSDRRLKDALLYVLQVGDGTLVVKRVTFLLDGSAKLFGDNPGYEPQIVQGDRIPELRVIGRVIWAGGLV